jgi:murein hydrolase activator
LTPLFRIALLSFGLLLFSQSSQANQQEELAQLRQRITALQQEMDKTSGSKSETVDALRESERAISNSNNKLHSLNQQLQAANLTLKQYQQQSRQLTLDIQRQQLLLSQLIHQQYLGGKQEYFKLLLNNQDPSQAARELQYFEYIAKSRAIWLKVMRDNLTKLSTISALAHQQNIELATLQAEQLMQKQNLLKEKSAHQQILNKIAQQLKQQRYEIGRLQRNENHLSRLLEKLALIVVPPIQSNKPKDSDPAAKQSRNFAFPSLKGKLSLPVKGKVNNKFGTRRSDSPVLWKGLFVHSASNQTVNAVASGRVIFADWLRGFGNLLIIDHGLGYMSLYGNNETLYKQVGDELHSGEIIAVVGNSGGNEHYGLYFELRHEGIPLDPAKWIKGRASKTR